MNCHARRIRFATILIAIYTVNLKTKIELNVNYVNKSDAMCARKMLPLLYIQIHTNLGIQNICASQLATVDTKFISIYTNMASVAYIWIISENKYKFPFILICMTIYLRGIAFEIGALMNIFG